MLKNDKWIREMAAKGMIEPFEPTLIKEVDGRGVLSWGLSGFGYDLRLSSKEFFVFRHIPGTVINPKRFNPNNLEKAELQEDEDGKFYILPSGSYALGVALERLSMPRNCIGLCIGKSTMARCGIILNCTPAEPMWSGHLTLEFSNSSAADCRIYCEGIAQMLFFEGDICETSYSDRSGKYNNQPEQVVIAKV